MMAATLRLDLRLVEDGLVASRSRARDLILRGFVSVDGAVCDKPARTIAADARVVLHDDTPRYVSRGAEKLIAGLDHFGFDPSGLRVLDAGASTGGFTQVLLERGAIRVFAVDVGQAQLHATLSNDARVVSIEKCDARTLSREQLDAPIEAIVADVSFIALSKVLPAILDLAVPGGWFVGLIKPQFELDPADIGKGGIVRDDEAKQRAIARVEAAIAARPGWCVLGIMRSPILGGSGNEEFLIGARRDG